MALDFGSYLNKEQPQENQFLQGNPATQPNAQTSWMNPDTSDWGKYSGDMSYRGGALQQNTPPANGTALGAISAGQVPGQTGQTFGGGASMGASPSNPGQTPLGFDATKWNDPNKHDPKYDVGRLVSSGASNEQVQQMLAQQYPGWTVSGKDIITDPQGLRWDFRFDQEGANKPMWEGVDQGGGGGPQSFMGNAGGGQQNSFMQMLMQMLMGGQGQQSGTNRFMPTPGRDLPNQQFNPSGGYIPPSGNTGFSGYGGGNNPRPGTPLPYPDFGQLGTSYLNGGNNYSPIRTDAQGNRIE